LNPDLVWSKKKTTASESFAASASSSRPSLTTHHFTHTLHIYPLLLINTSAALTGVAALLYFALALNVQIIAWAHQDHVGGCAICIDDSWMALTASMGFLRSSSYYLCVVEARITCARPRDTLSFLHCFQHLVPLSTSPSVLGEAALV
jgi:hypothetical protein